MFTQLDQMKYSSSLSQWTNIRKHTAKKFWFMYAQDRNCPASVPNSPSLCLWAIYMLSFLGLIFRVLKLNHCVANPGCISRILIFTQSRILDPKTAMKDRGEKKFVPIPFFWRHKFHKIELFYSWNVAEKKLGLIFKELLNFLPKKL